jgi:hypothetical protein
MTTQAHHIQGQILRNVFGPDKWCPTAMRVLSLSESRCYELASGRAPFTRRHLIVIAAYAKNRLNARAARIAEAVKKAEEQVCGGLQVVARGKALAEAALVEYDRIKGKALP